MSFSRSLSKYLDVWKEKSNRKPLIVRGARQVGKTTLITDFGKNYSNFLYANLERNSYAKLFKELEN
ncbi:MAG: AAA family ATPase, partial [Bacteroidota bacterium]